MLEDIKRLLGINGTTAQDEMLNGIISLTEFRLKNLLGGAETVPETLRYIVTEVSIARFNRIGSEGLASHSVEGESMSWSDDDFKSYSSDIEAYQSSKENAKKGVVRFI